MMPLAAYAEWFAAGTVFLCVVDPGVGGTRPPIILEADGRWYVGYERTSSILISMTVLMGMVHEFPLAVHRG
jgi:S-adenosylmethionine hydrolase